MENTFQPNMIGNDMWREIKDYLIFDSVTVKKIYDEDSMEECEKCKKGILHEEGYNPHYCITIIEISKRDLSIRLIIDEEDIGDYLILNDKIDLEICGTCRGGEPGFCYIFFKANSIGISTIMGKMELNLNNNEMKYVRTEIIRIINESRDILNWEKNTPI